MRIVNSTHGRHTWRVALGRTDVETAYVRLSSDKDVQLVDVRQPTEWARSGVVPKAKLIPLAQLAARAQELDRERPVFVVCEHGMRSRRGAAILARESFSEVCSIDGGMRAWIRSGYEVETCTD